MEWKKQQQQYLPLFLPTQETYKKDTVDRETVQFETVISRDPSVVF